MLLEREPYKTTFKVFTFIGFWDEIPIWQKRITFHAALFFMLLEEFLIIPSILKSETLEGKLDAMKVLALLPFINYSMYSFVKNKQKLKDLTAVIDQIERENPSATYHIEKGFVFVKIVFRCVVSFMMLVLVLFALTPIVIGQLICPLYIPRYFIAYESWFFYAYWLLESIIAVHSFLSYISIHEFRCSLLVVFYHVMECFREKLRSLKISKLTQKEAKVEIEKCIKFHLQLRQ